MSAALGRDPSSPPQSAAVPQQLAGYWRLLGVCWLLPLARLSNGTRMSAAPGPAWHGNHHTLPSSSDLPAGMSLPANLTQRPKCRTWTHRDPSPPLRSNPVSCCCLGGVPQGPAAPVPNPLLPLPTDTAMLAAAQAPLARAGRPVINAPRQGLAAGRAAARAPALRRAPLHVAFGSKLAEAEAESKSGGCRGRVDTAQCGTRRVSDSG